MPHPATVSRFPGRHAEIGEGLPVCRLLPTQGLRLVGPWCFLDHAGPADYAAGQGLNVGPHPHIGLQTFTWMIEGEVLHKDSLGYEQLIRPGQVNLMTAGRGIVHAELSASPDAGRIHAAQLWIALPDAERQRPPAFHHYPELPRLTRDGFVLTLLAGSALGQTAPAEVYSPLVGLDLTAAGAAATTLPLQGDFEHGLVLLEGSVQVDGDPLPQDVLHYLPVGTAAITLRAGADGCRVLVVGGAPLHEDILVWWNFVARTTEEIVQASADWQAGRRFEPVPGVSLARLQAPDVAGLRLKGGR